MADELPDQSFMEWLRKQRNGSTHEDLSAALADLTSAVYAHGKAGTLTFTIKLEPQKDNPDILFVYDEIKVKRPQPKRKPSVFFPDADGRLHRDDPRQMQFEGLQVVEGEREPDSAERAAGDDK